MKFPAENAAPFEFARPILLLAALPFVVGFGGYLTAKAPIVTHAMTPSSAAHSPAAKASLPVDLSLSRRKQV